MAVGSASNPALARSLVRDSGSAALGTLLPNGAPFASHVITAPSEDGSPLLLLSRLAQHSRNLAADARASLLFVREPGSAEDPMAAVRLTLTGRVLPESTDLAKPLFLARHPEAGSYAGFADFSFFRFHAESGHLVAGFGRIVSLAPESFIGTASSA